MTALTRRAFAAAIMIFGLSLSVMALPAFAGQPEFFRGAFRGVAINGYDPVAYFNDNKPVAGSADISAEWKGVTWRFASQANKEAFVAAPEKYAPQYGGYCAYAVSQGATAPSDPEAFTIVDGKLYLNLSKDIREVWSQDIPGNISKANANWPKVLQ